MEERFYWLAFSAFPAIGPAKFRKLLAEFKTAKSAWEAVGCHPTKLDGLIGEETAEKFEKFRKEFSIEDYVKKLKSSPAGEVWYLTLLDEDYPQILKEISNPPFVLYGKGDKEFFARQPRVSDDAQLTNSESLSDSASLSKSRLQSKLKPTFSSSESGLPRFDPSTPTIAVVGARKTTEYGREVTKLLTAELVLSGFTIVSGLALGVDAVAHQTALENGGRTIAVLGCGVDCCNPAENQSIYNSILESGNCIVSEFPLGMKPTQWTFPARNRIIAGLSQGVLVTEGAEDSGSLITANFALKFNRKVLAVPGSITSIMSKGPYKLIAKGAKLVTSGEDILKELKVQSSPLRQGFAGQAKSKIINRKGDTKEEDLILKLLQNEALHFDEIVRRLKFNPSKLGSLLSLMEIKGMVRGLDGGMFSVEYS